MATNNAVNSPLSGTTGTGNFVGSTSATLVTVILGTPQSGNLSNCTGLPVGSITGLGTGVATWLATPTSANLASAVATTSTGSGSLVFATSPTLVTPTLGAASATSMTFSSTSGIIGTTTNNNAASGSVGEFISSIVLAASAVSLSNNTPKDLTSISLTAGDWDVYGNINFLPAGGSSFTALIAWTSITSATTPDPALYNEIAVGAVVPTSSNGINTPFQRYTLSGTTTVYISAIAGFTIGTMTMCGGIYARRVR